MYLKLGFNDWNDTLKDHTLSRRCQIDFFITKSISIFLDPVTLGVTVASKLETMDDVVLNEVDL
jgi:hypothetical protein